MIKNEKKECKVTVAYTEKMRGKYSFKIIIDNAQKKY